MRSDTTTAASEAIELLARRLQPGTDARRPWPAQSLAKGAAGVALLHIERAHAGTGTWRTAHDSVRAATAGDIYATGDASLNFGVPAISFILHAAGTDGTARYGAALEKIDRYVAALVHHRVDLALERIDRGRLPDFTEYDLLHGLTGIGAHLLASAPGDEALGRILAYLIRLTYPLRTGGRALPGWWVHHGPNLMKSASSGGGHANLGMAHGITGPLALLVQALRRGITVDGHAEAVECICAFLDSWRQETRAGCWWPQWITRDDLRAGRLTQLGPGRPSWCYGTPGLARTQQVAAIATGDTRRRQMAENALAACLSDPEQLGQITDTSLCHGWAGLSQTAARAARDELTPQISVHLPHLTKILVGSTLRHDEQATGLLEGQAGLALALQTAAHKEPPISGWDTCFMIN